MKTINQAGKVFLISEEPITWTELTTKVSALPERVIDTLSFGRSYEIQNRYSSYISDVGIEAVNRLLNQQVENSILLSKDNIQVKITYNRFPYNFKANLLHLIVWTDNSVKEIINFFESNNLVEFEHFVMFTNSSNIKSIDLNHHHLVTTESNLLKILNLF